MRAFSKRFILWILLASTFAWAPQATSTTVLQMNLEQLCQRADKIFRGTVLSAKEGTVQVGGGQLPTVTYRVRVEESFKGQFSTVKDIQIAEIQMLGKPKPVQVGNLKRGISVLGLPNLKTGQTYLLMVTRPSSVNLSTTVGLGQGRFHVIGKGTAARAVNEFNNSGLFLRMSQTARTVPARGPVQYSQLAEMIRGAVAAQAGGVQK